MSALITIKGRLRKEDEQGKNSCRRLRTRGEVPANLLDNAKSTALAIEAKLLPIAWKKGKTFQLEFNGTVKSVLIKELQIDPVKRDALHVDLMYA